MVPLVKRTWAPTGQTPILPHRLCHYQKISAIAAITISPCRRRLGLYLHLYPAADICFEAVVIFLQQLHRHLPNNTTLIWDNWGVHRSRQTRAFLETQSWLRVEPLPPYAPELNAVEYFWTQSNYHGLSNHALLGLDCLEEGITEQFLEIRSDQDLLRSFVRQTKLPIALCQGCYIVFAQINKLRGNASVRAWEKGDSCEYRKGQRQ